MYGSLFLSYFSFDEKSVPVHFSFLKVKEIKALKHRFAKTAAYFSNFPAFHLCTYGAE